MRNFPNRSPFLGSRRPHLAAGGRPARTVDARAHGAQVQQSRHGLRRCRDVFFQEMVPGQNAAPFNGGKMVSKIGFCFYGKW